MLSVSNLRVSYGWLEIVHGISFHVCAGEIITLIGANGAGKTTTFRAISGLKRRTSGEVVFDNKKVDFPPAYMLAREGLALVPEGRHVFPDMSVDENLEMGAFRYSDVRVIRQAKEEVLGWFPRLRERLRQQAGTLSGGEQQMLAIGRAMMSRPKLLLLDEPSLGLAPAICAEIAKIIKGLKMSGKTIILVEQNARMALNLADRAYVMDRGTITKHGPACDIISDPEVKRAFLGNADA